MSRFKSRLIELSLTLAPLLLCACGTDTADGGGAGAPASGKGGAGVGGAIGGTGGASGGAGGASTAGTAGASTAGTAGATTGGTGGATTGGTGGASGGSGGSAGSGGSGGVLPFVLTSPAFMHNEDCSTDNLGACNVFPQENLLDTFMDGGNISPELNWGPGPAGTMSYAIVLHDYSNGYTHWAMWNIPASTLQLPEDLPRETNPATPAGSQQVSFDDQDDGYQGPGAVQHVYEFRLYALDTATFSPGNPGDQGAVRGDLEAGADGAVLGTTDLRGKSTP